MPGTYDISTMWGADQNSLYSDQRSLPGMQTEERKRLITADTCQANESRKTLGKKLVDTRSEMLKERFRQQYQETDKIVKRMARADKREGRPGK